MHFHTNNINRAYYAFAQLAGAFLRVGYFSICGIVLEGLSIGIYVFRFIPIGLFRTGMFRETRRKML